jgi:hypothetical protein
MCTGRLVQAVPQPDGGLPARRGGQWVVALILFHPGHPAVRQDVRTAAR